MSITFARSPNRPDSALPLTEQDRERQIARGNYITERGERYAVAVDNIEQAKRVRNGREEALVYQGRKLWMRDAAGRVFRPGTVLDEPDYPAIRKAWDVADRLTGGRARNVRNVLAFGHQVDVSMRGGLAARHWHRGWANPFEPDKLEAPLDPRFATLMATHWPHEYKARLLEDMLRVPPRRARAYRKQMRQLPDVHDFDTCRLGLFCPARSASWEQFYRDNLLGAVGWVEDLGWLRTGLVTDAFVSEEIDELVSATASEYADFDFHEVGTSSTAESNNHTALQATSGIARATGSPTDSDPDYVNVGTITADTSETWEEHGLFNNSSGAAMMDRNLTGGQGVASSDQVEYTYTLTKNPES